MKNYRLCYGEWLNFTMHKSDLLLFTFYRSNLTTIQRFCVQSSNSSLTFYYWHSILNYIHLATEAISIQNKNIHYKWVAIKENFYNIESMQLIRDTSLQFWLVCLQVTVFHRWSQQSEQRRQTLGNQYGLSSRMKKWSYNHFLSIFRLRNWFTAYWECFASPFHIENSPYERAPTAPNAPRKNGKHEISC